MFAINVRESERTANDVTFVFHALFAGNIGQPPRLGPGPATARPPPPEPPPPGEGTGASGWHATKPAVAETTTTRVRIRPRMDTCIGLLPSVT